MNTNKLEVLARELFVDNCKHIKNKCVCPLNADVLAKGFIAVERFKKAKEKELYDSLVEVASVIARDSGISAQTYERHKYAINSLARDLTGQRWWGSALAYLCEREDREGKNASREQIARFFDKKYGEFVSGRHVNIFDEEYKESGFEGTLFQTDYDARGNLETFRIFHQGHRNSLKVTQVNIEELIAKIKQYVAEFNSEAAKPQFGLTLDKQQYMDKIREFNTEFGKWVMIETMRSTGEEHVVARFNENPEELANKLVGLSAAHGVDLTSRRGPMTYSVSAEWSGKFMFVDLFLPVHLEKPWANENFDPVKHKNCSTLILPGSSSEFVTPLAIELMKMYVAAQKE